MKRFLFAIPVSLVLAMLLFLLMAWLVGGPKQQSQPMLELTAVNFVIDEQQQNVSRRTRVLPPPPTLEPLPTDYMTAPESTMQLSAPIAPGLISTSALNIEVGSVDINAPEIGSFESVSPIMPIHRVEPRYPYKASQRRIEGYVVIRFNIDEKGRPVDLEVIEAKPKRLFEREAVKALKQWRYQPMLEQGQPVTHHGQTVKLEFRQPK
ncbi:energy transducer TonB [Vibrio nereis]|uniref:energy transducer TonB n=1 Tax=Vibrio nereis TaxID=693 RepID=UPI0024940EEE|nr:energy transducer TonB [Vibrio nereis]